MLCENCNHELENNNHGIDQNDGYINDEGKLILTGLCTYCKICNLRFVQIMKEVEEKRNAKLNK